MHYQRTRPLPDAESFLHTRQVANLLHLYPKTIARWATDGRLPHQRTLGGHLRGLIDIDEDQIRIYILDGPTTSEAVILGARVIEERQDFWIVR